MIKPVSSVREQACKEINAGYEKIQSLAQSFHRNIDLISPSALVVNGKDALVESVGRTAMLCKGKIVDETSIRLRARIRSLSSRFGIIPGANH